jgi:adenylate cyclase
MERTGPRRLSRYRFRHILSQKYLYDGLDAVERTYMHEDIGNALEALYSEGATELVAVAPQLARHFREAGLTEKAVRYLHLAGVRAQQLSAYREALSYLEQGLDLFLTLPEPGDAAQHRARAEQELALQLALGMTWMGITGFPAQELRDCFSRARELCEEMGNSLEMSRVLGELAMHYFVLSQHRNARELAEQALELAQRAGDPLFVTLGHWYLGVILFAQGEYQAALDQIEQVIAFYDPQTHHREFVRLRGSDPGLSAMAYHACCLWCLGYPDQALSRSQEAIAYARDLDHPFTLADVLCYAGCMVDSMRQDGEALARDAEALVDLSSRTTLPWMETALRYRSDAALMRTLSQDTLAEARSVLAATRASVHRCFVTGNYCAVASAYLQSGQSLEGLAVIDEVLAYVEQSDERHFEAEIHRLRAELLLLQGDETGAEASYLKALEVARRQNARSWELRAATGLARLWQRQGRIDEAEELLAGVYGWFTEGFDTPDLQEAKALIEELS